jgi:hypothetical protein
MMKLSPYFKWSIEVILMLIVAFVLAVGLGGCASRIPVLSADCEIERYKQQWETVEECKMASDKREDSRFKKEQRRTTRN